MWVPKSADQIADAAERGELEETPSFDAKAALPEPRKNSSLAVDVAAMSTEGGVLLYGVAEDEHKRPTIPSPIPLVGAADRVAQIVETSISEVPLIEPREFPCDDDPSMGYVVVIVPQSARAPHQVTVGNDLRYYGRGAKGNRILSEGEVARLYRRRNEWEQDRDSLLGEAILASNVPERQGAGYVHAFARPVVLDRNLWERAASKLGNRLAIHQALLDRLNATKLAGKYGPTLDHAHYWGRKGADEWRLSTRDEAERLNPDALTHLVELRINIDGRGHLFCGRATDSRSAAQAPVVIEVVIAGNVEAFFAAMALIYDAAGYHGYVDVGVAITGLQGAVSFKSGRYGQPETTPYSAPTFTRTERIAAAQLQAPDEVAHGLLRHFYEATSGIDGLNMFVE